MGIRFRCEHCQSELHVKNYQGGKRGRCPHCQGKLRIPTTSSPELVDADSDSSGALVSRLDPQSPAATSESNPLPPPANQRSTRGASADESARAIPTEPAGPAEPESVDTPEALAAAPDAHWYVQLAAGGRYGPAESETMRLWLTENRVGQDALVWRETWPEWLPAENVFHDFFASAAAHRDEAGQTDPVYALQAPPAAVPPPAPPPQPNAPAGPPAPTGQRLRTTRRSRRRRNYRLWIVLLSLLTIGLLITLIVVLSLQ